MLNRPRDYGDSLRDDPHDDDDEDDFRHVQFDTEKQQCYRTTHGVLAGCMLILFIALMVDIQQKTINLFAQPTRTPKGCLSKFSHMYEYCETLQKCIHKYLEPCPGGVGNCATICHGIDLGDELVASCTSKEASQRDKQACARKLGCNCDNYPECEKLCLVKVRGTPEALKDHHLAMKKCKRRDCVDRLSEPDTARGDFLMADPDADEMFAGPPKTQAQLDALRPPDLQ